MTIPEGNINLGRKGQFGSVNINQLNSGIKKADIKDPEQIKLFQKFDKDGNNILTNDEISELKQSLGTYADHGKITKREAKNFVKEQGLKGEVDKNKALEFISNLDTLSDNISSTYESTSKDGTRILNVEYAKDADGNVQTDSYDYSNGNLLAKELKSTGENGEKVVTQTFGDNGKVAQEVTVENGATTTVKYDADGNVESTIRQKGAVTEYLDKDGKVTKKEIDKGSDMKQVIEYEYDADGKVSKTTTTNTDGSSVIEDSTTITTINTDGSKSVKNKETGEVQNYDADGKLIETKPETENTDGESYTHNVEYGDTWYGIVQAKYGITDHKQTMEIVRQLKAHNNVDRNATNMPSQIELPPSVTLKDGTEVALANKDAVVDKSHNNLTNPDHIANRKPVSAVGDNASGEPKPGSPAVTLSLLENMYDASQDAFDDQMKKDGWAADVADGISNLWGWAQEDGNQAWRVRRDLKAYKSNVDALKAAASQGDEQFKAKFQELYGVTYNQQAIDDYCANPTEANFKRAFGNNKDIATRVNNYNESQDKGAKVVKTSVVVAASVAAGVATGGLAGVAVAAVGTAAARTTVEVTDLATNDIEGDINAESMKEIGKQAAIEGAVSGALKGVSVAASAIKGASATAATTSEVAVVGSNQAGGTVVKATTTSSAGAAGASGTVVKSTATSSAGAGARTGAGASANAGAKAGATGANAGSSASANAGAKAGATGTNAGSSAGANAGSTGARAGSNAGASSSANAGAGTGASAVAKETAKKLSDKVCSRGLSSLTSEETSQLAKILGVSPQELANLSRAQIKKLLIQFHPDKCKLDYAHEISTILTTLLKTAK